MMPELGLEDVEDKEKLTISGDFFVERNLLDRPSSSVLADQLCKADGHWFYY